METNCPTCTKQITLSQRYPDAVCSECYELTVTENGDKIMFGNESIFGGFMSIVNDKEGTIHECYINGKKCYADEARFGGIVIQVVDAQN